MSAYPITRVCCITGLRRGGKADRGLAPKSRWLKRLARKKITPAIFATVKEYDKKHQFQSAAVSIQRLLKKYPCLSLSTIARVLKKICQNTLIGHKLTSINGLFGASGIGNCQLFT